jgi:nicotinate phosphoribosyltransferase
MIQSILDNDLYKFTMQQAVRRCYPAAEAEYRLTNRGGTPFPEGLAQGVREGILAMAGLALTEGQHRWLQKTCPYLGADYLAYLSEYRFDPEEVRIAQKGLDLEIIVLGPWQRTILWEVPLMALISEVYFALTAPETLSREEIQNKNRAKARRLADHHLSFADFGTRRRFSFENHDRLIRDILSVKGNSLTGTSNVHLAQKWDLAPVGTMAHEWIMFHAILDGYGRANALAMDAWKSVYPDALGIALTDTYTTEKFLEIFTRDRADRFAGVRQDSGEPEAFALALIDHYHRMDIDPKTKTIVFSDGLDIRRALAIHTACRGRIRDAYGIGTHLTNDIGPAPLNMVIKLYAGRPDTSSPWQKTVKLSDDNGKHTGDREEINRCLASLGLS